MRRCQWVENKPDFYIDYHDRIWGRPEHNDLALFEWLVLESFHVGLSWQLILSKRENFQAAFDAFDYKKIAGYDEEKIESLLQDSGIVRHEGKIRATITNAQAFLTIQAEHGSFGHFIWSFTEGKTIINQTGQHRTSSLLSDQVTKRLKEYGFKFIGSVTIYSYLQAVGIINDHELECDFK